MLSYLHYFLVPNYQPLFLQVKILQREKLLDRIIERIHYNGFFSFLTYYNGFVCFFLLFPCLLLSSFSFFSQSFYLQGFVEDQFGLGLIAKAVEGGISVIKLMGIMIFNMGGRPGQGVCKRLFERRGFRVTKLWQTKVIQASRPFI